MDEQPAAIDVGHEKLTTEAIDKHRARAVIGRWSHRSIYTAALISCAPLYEHPKTL